MAIPSLQFLDSTLIRLEEILGPDSNILPMVGMYYLLSKATC
jgi:hypothetical protein